MSNIKINISVMADSPPPKRERRPKPKISLNDKIDYAVECIECDEDKVKAITFLQEAYNYLNTLQVIKEEHTIMMRKITPVLTEYGAKFPTQTVNNKDEENKDG